MMKTKKAPDASGAFVYGKLNTSHFARFQRASADVYTFWLTINQDTNLLYVYSPSTTTCVVRMRYTISSFWRFASNDTFARHENTSFIGYQLSSLTVHNTKCYIGFNKSY